MQEVLRLINIKTTLCSGALFHHIFVYAIWRLMKRKLSCTKREKCNARDYSKYMYHEICRQILHAYVYCYTYFKVVSPAPTTFDLVAVLLIPKDLLLYFIGIRPTTQMAPVATTIRQKTSQPIFTAQIDATSHET